MVKSIQPQSLPVDVEYEASSPPKSIVVVESRMEKKSEYACRNFGSAKLIMIIFIIAGCIAVPFIAQHCYSNNPSTNPISLGGTDAVQSDEIDEEYSESMETTSTHTTQREDIDSSESSQGLTPSKEESPREAQRKLDDIDCDEIIVNKGFEKGFHRSFDQNRGM